jgi:hypothetical protein
MAVTTAQNVFTRRVNHNSKVYSELDQLREHLWKNYSSTDHGDRKTVPNQKSENQPGDRSLEIYLQIKLIEGIGSGGNSAVVTAFRKIVVDLFGLSNDLTKFDYRSGGRDNG